MNLSPQRKAKVALGNLNLLDAETCCVRMEDSSGCGVVDALSYAQPCHME
jgi:hypothetical protein